MQTLHDNFDDGIERTPTILRMVNGSSASKQLTPLQVASKELGEKFWGKDPGNSLVPDPQTAQKRMMHFLKIFRHAPQREEDTTPDLFAGRQLVEIGEKAAKRKIVLQPGVNRGPRQRLQVATTVMETFDSDMAVYTDLIDYYAAQGDPVGLTALELEYELPNVYNEFDVSPSEQSSILLGRTTLQLAMLSLRTEPTINYLSAIAKSRFAGENTH